MEKAKLGARELEAVAKGFASWRRIVLLDRIQKTAKISARDLAESLSWDERTVGAHLRKMNRAGLLSIRLSRHRNRLELQLSPAGREVLAFLRKLR